MTTKRDDFATNELWQQSNMTAGLRDEPKVYVLTGEEIKDAQRHYGHKAINKTGVGDSRVTMYCVTCGVEYTAGSIR